MTIMSVKKRVVFAASAIGLSLLIAVGLLWGLDLLLHKKFEQIAGLNMHGYRGPVVGAKTPNEQRIVVLGGSTALGYGVAPAEAFPAVLERHLNDRLRPNGGPRVRLLNIAYNSEGAYAYVFNLRYYERLDYDVAIFYTGFNDLGGRNEYVYRRTSPIFRLTGYMPILPLIFQEKAMALRYGGDIEAAYRGQKTVFRPNLVARTAASVLETTARVSQSLEQQLGRVATETAVEEVPTLAECGPTWGHYCQSIYRAVDEVVRRGGLALVVSEPFVADPLVAQGQTEQQHAMRQMLQQRFGSSANVRYVNAGRAVDLGDPALCYDGVHLTAEGNARVAEFLLEPVLESLP